jgi:hypothetical protein
MKLRLLLWFFSVKCLQILRHIITKLRYSPRDNQKDWELIERGIIFSQWDLMLLSAIFICVSHVSYVLGNTNLKNWFEIPFLAYKFCHDFSPAHFISFSPCILSLANWKSLCLLWRLNELIKCLEVSAQYVSCYHYNNDNDVLLVNICSASMQIWSALDCQLLFICVAEACLTLWISAQAFFFREGFLESPQTLVYLECIPIMSPKYCLWWCELSLLICNLLQGKDWYLNRYQLNKSYLIYLLRACVGHYFC